MASAKYVPAAPAKKPVSTNPLARTVLKVDRARNPKNPAIPLLAMITAGKISETRKREELVMRFMVML